MESGNLLAVLKQGGGGGYFCSVDFVAVFVFEEIICYVLSNGYRVDGKNPALVQCDHTHTYSMYI